ncbi:hypothetical protein BC826DRAFT_967215 [Russula brevipes]|nr:hypothetical protein BC826DRAFT_967215 [Russula brevipes]
MMQMIVHSVGVRRTTVSVDGHRCPSEKCINTVTTWGEKGHGAVETSRSKTQRRHAEQNLHDIEETKSRDRGTFDRPLQGGVVNNKASSKELRNRKAMKGGKRRLWMGFKEKAQTRLPTATAKWTNFAIQAGLPEDPTFVPLKYFDTPVYHLPPSFHKAVFENSWHRQDVYSEPMDQETLKILDPYIDSILALFHGRVIDTTEGAMSGSDGGRVVRSHSKYLKVIYARLLQVGMIGGTLFFVIEAKFDEPYCNNFARLFLEFLATAKENQKITFEGLRIYGILTDLGSFSFYSYDPKSNTFCEDDAIVVGNLRDKFLSDMIPVTNKIFGLVLFAFIEGLRATVKKEQRTSEEYFRHLGHLNTIVPSNPPRKPDALEQAQKSIKGWELALCNAEGCCQKFMEEVTTIEDMEIRSTVHSLVLSRSSSNKVLYMKY